jgi:hypothetical protein
MWGQRRTAVAAASLVVCGLLTVAAGAVAAAGGKGRADSSTIYAASTHTTGGFTYAAGQAADKVLGQVAITYRIKAVPTGTTTINLKASPVVEYTATGSLTGKATATLTVGANGAETVSNGKFSLTKGAGSLRGHSLTGTFSGVGNSTANYLVLHSKGRFK